MMESSCLLTLDNLRKQWQIYLLAPGSLFIKYGDLTKVCEVVFSSNCEFKGGEIPTHLVIFLLPRFLVLDPEVENANTKASWLAYGNFSSFFYYPHFQLLILHFDFCHVEIFVTLCSLYIRLTVYQKFSFSTREVYLGILGKKIGLLPRHSFWCKCYILFSVWRHNLLLRHQDCCHKRGLLQMLAVPEWKTWQIYNLMLHDFNICQSATNWNAKEKISQHNQIRKGNWHM